MNRLITYLAVLLACGSLFTLAACGNSSAEPTDNTGNSAISQTEDDTANTNPSAGEEQPITDGSDSDGEADNGLDADTLTDEEILETVEPYLEDLVYQDPESYASFGDFLKANLNLDESTVVSATLYMGAPNQNTGYFLMITPTETADTAIITEKLEKQAESMVHTAEQGYTQGYTEYSIVEESGRMFLVMQPTAERYQELLNTLSELGE